MEYLQVAIRLLLVGLIDGPASVFVGATGACKINLAASSPAGELAAPSHKTMSQTTWYQNRGPATFSTRDSHPLSNASCTGRSQAEEGGVGCLHAKATHDPQLHVSAPCVLAR